MRMRGHVYWAWADPTLHHQSHEETLSDGTRIDVRVRFCRPGGTQMFLGIYARSGMALYEEAFTSQPGESMTRMLGEWLKLVASLPRALLPPIFSPPRNRGRGVTAGWSADVLLARYG